MVLPNAGLTRKVLRKVWRMALLKSGFGKNRIATATVQWPSQSTYAPRAADSKDLGIAWPKAEWRMAEGEWRKRMARAEWRMPHGRARMAHSARRVALGACRMADGV